jgi:hypothetical protein
MSSSTPGVSSVVLLRGRIRDVDGHPLDDVIFAAETLQLNLIKLRMNKVENKKLKIKKFHM